MIRFASRHAIESAVLLEAWQLEDGAIASVQGGWMADRQGVGGFIRSGPLGAGPHGSFVCEISNLYRKNPEIDPKSQ